MTHISFQTIRLIACGGLLLAVGSFAQGVRAESSDATYEEYKIVIAQAVDEYGLEHWANAIDLFQKAHAIKPNARTLRGMGLAAFEDKRYVDAVRWLSAALLDPTLPLTAEMRADIKPVIARAREFVGFYEINNDPSDLTIQIDGRPAVIEDGMVKMDAGGRHLVASARGFETLERYLNVKTGDNGVLGIKLEPAQSSSAAPGAPAASDGAPVAEVIPPTTEFIQPLETDSSNSNVVPWVLVGTGAAIAVAGGVFIGLCIKEVNTVNRGGWLAEVESARKRVLVYSGLGFALVGVGVATAAFGTVLLLTNDEPANESAAGAAFELRAGFGGLSVAGQF